MFNLFYYSMKNIKLFSLLFVAAAMIFAGCTKETESVEPGGGEGEGTEEGLVYKEFTVGVSESSGSKSRTELGPADEQGNRSVLWQKGDEIRVFADVDGANPDGYKFTVTEIQDGGNTATISGEVANAEKFYALYPYDVYNSTGGLIKDNGSVYICANIPDNQSVSVDGGYDPKACISVAELNSDGGEFKLACGILGFQFKDKTATSVEIKEIQVDITDRTLSNNAQYMKLNVIDGSIPSGSNISKIRTIKIQPEVEGGTFLENTTYYVCLPPINGEDITVKFIDSESASLDKVWSGFTLNRHDKKEIYNIALIEADYHLTIDDAGKFVNWYKDNINKYPKVTLSGVIDMVDQEPLKAKAFSGILEGTDGCEIKNLVMNISLPTDNNGLFASLNGAKVSNITLTDLTINDGIYVGSICGYANNSTIVGCKVKGGSVLGSYVGGVVGDLTSGTVDGCEVTDIVLETNGGKLSVCGGLVAFLRNSSRIDASFVTGNMSSSVGVNIGGIIGSWGSVNAKIVSCYSFVKLPSGAGYVYGKPYEDGSSTTIDMVSSRYVTNEVLEEYPNGTISVEGLQTQDTINTMNDYLEQANSGYRYVVNPATITHFSTPPLILEKAQ